MNYEDKTIETGRDVLNAILERKLRGDFVGEDDVSDAEGANTSYVREGHLEIIRRRLLEVKDWIGDDYFIDYGNRFLKINEGTTEGEASQLQAEIENRVYECQAIHYRRGASLKNNIRYFAQDENGWLQKWRNDKTKLLEANELSGLDEPESLTTEQVAELAYSGIEGIKSETVPKMFEALYLLAKRVEQLEQPEPQLNRETSIKVGLSDRERVALIYRLGIVDHIKASLPADHSDRAVGRFLEQILAVDGDNARNIIRAVDTERHAKAKGYNPFENERSAARIQKVVDKSGWTGELKPVKGIKDK